MGLDVPDLDDVEFEELFEEARRRIPVHYEEWSDHNAHDTGIAILEMLAWLTETYTYQLNRVTQEHREKYLTLLGTSRRPPRPATTAIAVEPKAGVAGVTIPAGEKLTVDDRSGVEKTFETTRALTLVDAAIDVLLTHSGGDGVDNTIENETDGIHFRAFGDDPAVDDAMYLGFETDPFAAVESLDLTVEFHTGDLPDPVPEDPDSPFEPSVEVVWECPAVYVGGESGWSELRVLEDGTDAFYGSGVVTLERPKDWDPVPDVDVLERPPGNVWVRCRLESAGYEVPPQLESVRVNVVEVDHRSTVGDESLHRPDGSLETTAENGQEFFFEHSPVLEAEVSIDGQRWREVADLDVAEPADACYVLDHERGSIRFGDGVTGATPPVGRRVLAERYVHGGGTEGNVSIDSQWSFHREGTDPDGTVDLEDLSVFPVAPATGGSDGESIGDAVERFKRELKSAKRGVTLEDYADVATTTPGLRFGRATAACRTCHTVSGDPFSEIEIVVVPYSPSSRPEPSVAFLEAVREHVGRNRLLTDRVRVDGPTYVEVGADVVVSTTRTDPEHRLADDVRDALLAYLDPISGFDGGGWPFGRPLYVSDVKDVVGAISDVDYVLSVTITPRGDSEIDDNGNVLIPDLSLFALAENDVSVTIADHADLDEGRR